MAKSGYCPVVAYKAAVEFWRLRKKALKEGGRVAEEFTKKREELARIVAPWAPAMANRALDELGSMKDDVYFHVQHGIFSDKDSSEWSFLVVIRGMVVSFSIGPSEKVKEKKTVKKKKK